MMPDTERLDYSALWKATKLKQRHKLQLNIGGIY